MTWKRLLRPPIWVMAILTAVSACALTAIFVCGWEQTIPAYLCYVLAAYTLTVICIFCALALPGRYRRLRQRLQGTRYFSDRAFRMRISLHLSLGISLLYGVLQMVQWCRFRSWWFVVLAVYYGILSVMRFLLAGSVHSQADLAGEWRRARACACILLLVNLFLSAAVLMILYQGRGFDYPGILIYAMALYTFYSTIHAVVELVRNRKLGSPVLSAAGMVSLSAALVSMLSLETAMFHQFGAAMAPADQRLMIILTGAGISIAVVTLSVTLLVRSRKLYRQKTMQQESHLTKPNGGF